MERVVFDAPLRRETFMHKFILALSVFALWCFFASNAPAAPLDLASADWSAKAPHNLASNPPTDEALKDFVAKTEDARPNGICSSHFVDLRHSGNLSLVVAYSYGRFCFLSIYDKTSSGFEETSLWLAHYADGPEIRDLGRDGNLQLIIPEDISEYEGAQHCMANWPVIFAWTGQGYGDVSSHFKGYYEQQLASIQRYLATAEAQKHRAEQEDAKQRPEPAESTNTGVPAGLQFGGENLVAKDERPQTMVEYGPNGAVHVRVLHPVSQPSSPQQAAALEPDEMDLDCSRAEAAKIERFLGISRDAGMSDAIRLKNSDNPHDRAFAADILSDIHTKEAADDLHVLASDPDHVVANSGRFDLERANQKPEEYIIQRQKLDAAGEPIQ